jgi:hypothetical protein
MKKGKVIEINSKYAIVMNTDMSYEKINCNNELKLGKSIYYFKEDLYKESRKNYKNVIIAAAMFFMILFIQPLALKPVTFGYISVDINPSIQLEIDKNLDVTKVEAKNKDAIDIVKNEWVGQNSKVVIDEIIKAAQSKGILNETRDFVLVSYYFDDDEDKNIENIFKESVNDLYDSSNKEFEIAVIEANSEFVKKPKKSDESIGRQTMNKEMNKKVIDLLEVKDQVKQNKKFTIYGNNKKNNMPNENQNKSENNNSDANDNSNNGNSNDNKGNNNGNGITNKPNENGFKEQKEEKEKEEKEKEADKSNCDEEQSNGNSDINETKGNSKNDLNNNNKSIDGKKSGNNGNGK